MPSVNSIYYDRHGAGKPILFIHPPGMGLVTFNLQLPLSNKYQVIRMDLPGNGNSIPPFNKITIPLLANSVIPVLNELKLEEVVICGYSNGGSIALEFALQYPERTAGIILIGGFPEVNSFLLQQEFQLGILTVKLGGLPLLAKVLGFAHGTTPDYKKEIEQYVLKSHPGSLYDMYVEGLKYTCTNRLYQIKSPLLLIYGAKDYYVHHYQYLFKERIKNTEVVYVSKSRHQIPTKHAAELNAIIHSFMDKV
ncbi:alpha/beta fold hydrolase [Bacillus salitolerans]|uniref:Alpha/beta fold hydrolase n=1 Tax=Bacillus salitolerans TaxID=1437434 RepID=A0ABW4LKD7_9BACI